MSLAVGGWGPTPLSSPIEAVRELRALVEARIVGAERSQQTRLGPSGLGTTCDRCLVLGLAEVPQRREVAWLPTLGTAIHEWLEAMVIATADSNDWLPEWEVQVGEIGGQMFTGHSDVFHVPSGTVFDWKLVGTSTMRKVSSGPALIYQRQAMLYGLGWENAGYRVQAVCIYYLPRNGLTLDDARPVILPYDREMAEETLTRARSWMALIQAPEFGLQAALVAAGEHNGHEFSCTRYLEEI